MHNLKKCRKIFIDFDGVIVDSNKFKEVAIEKSIIQIIGDFHECKEAISFFNVNAGISRQKKLTKFFNEEQVLEILEIYNNLCRNFFSNAFPTKGLLNFLNYVKKKYSHIKLFILSGGEKKEIKLFLENNNLSLFFEDILASERSKLFHLQNNQVSENDIFIGDSINDLKVSLKTGINFILFEEYKSLKSFPSQELINKNVLIKTKNFQTLLIKSLS